MYYLFGISNCDRVKKARTYLEKKSISFQFVDFKKAAPTVELILLWQKAFGDLAINTKGQTYKKHSAEFEKLTFQERVHFLIKYPSMIKRPILQKEKTVLCFGFDEKEYSKILGV